MEYYITKPFYHKLYSNMKVIQQYRVIDPYIYEKGINKIIHVSIKWMLKDNMEVKVTNIEVEDRYNYHNLFLKIQSDEELRKSHDESF